MYIWLRNFEGDGKSAKVSLEALTQENNRLIIVAAKGKIGKRTQKPIKRRSHNAMADKVEEKE